MSPRTRRFVLVAFGFWLLGVSQMNHGFSQDELETIWIKALGMSNDLDSILLETKEQLLDAEIDDDEVASLLEDVEEKLTEQSKNSSGDMRLEVRIGIANGKNGRKRSVQVGGSTGNAPPNMELPAFPQLPPNPGIEAMRRMQESMHQSLQRQHAFANHPIKSQTRSYSIGVKFADSTEPLGARIDGVFLEEKSTLLVGDVVTMANGFKIADALTVNELISIAGRTDQPIALTLLRDQKETIVSVVPVASGTAPQFGPRFDPGFQNNPPNFRPSFDSLQMEKLQMELKQLREAIERIQTEKRTQPKT